jgi:replicative DNA helicase
MNSLCNPEAEANLLSACVTNSGEFYRLADVLDPEVFTVPENRTIWEAMLYIRNNGGDADMMAVTARLITVDKAAFLAFSEQCARPVTSAIGTDELLTDLLVRRRTLAAIMEAQLNSEIANCLVSNTTEMVTAEDACNEVMRNVFDNQSRTHNTPEIPVGLKGIDERGGLHTTDLTIIAGETSMGKTSLALTFALNAATAGVGVGVVTLEMSVMQLAARMVSGDAQVSSSDILYKRLGADDYNRVGAAVERAGTLPMWFNRKAQSVAKICAWIRQLAYRKKAKLFVIDYLQLISMGKIDNRVQEIGDICATLKRLAGEIDVSIILLSQLSRDRMNPYPSLARLRGSGEIESNADNVIFVYRPEYYKTEGKNLAYKDRFANVSTNGTAEIIVAKGRNTGTTSFIAAYEKQYTRFSDLADMPTYTMVTANREQLPF